MMQRALMLAAGVMLATALPALAAPHWEADVTWTAPATGGQTGYHVQRKIGLTGAYGTLTATPLPATAVTYRDVGPYQDGQVICWRVMVQPQNPNGTNVGPETCLGTPIQFPGPVGSPAINYRFIPN